MRNLTSVALTLLALSLAASAAAPKPVILSTDIGNEIDDQWAVVYLLTNPAFDVRAILSAHAPSLPAPSAHATYLKLLEVVEQRLALSTHPPLLEGSSLPLADSKTPRTNDAVRFLIDASRAFSRDARLDVLTIGAATDVASAVLEDPSIVDRIRVIAMGFKNLREGGNEYNVQNDPTAWRVLLDSGVPVVIGSGDVCAHDLALSFDGARNLVSEHGAVGAWLWQEYQAWYYRNVKPLRVDDFSKPWVIWDIITLAYEQRMTQQQSIPRPRMRDDLTFEQPANRGAIEWITSVNAARLWPDFLAKLDAYQRTHATGAAVTQ